MEVHGPLQAKHTHNDNDNKTEKLVSDVGALNWASCRASAILYLSFNSLENATWKNLGLGALRFEDLWYAAVEDSRSLWFQA